MVVDNEFFGGQFGFIVGHDINSCLDEEYTVKLTYGEEFIKGSQLKSIGLTNLEEEKHEETNY